MKRLLMFLSATALLIAPLTPIGGASANAVSKYETTSYRDGGLVLRMSTAKGSVLSPGEEISLTYQTSNDALVILFNIDTEGYVHLLHPYNGYPATARARQTYRVPSGSDKLLVSGETGMEFIFALTVPDRSSLDETELSYLRAIENQPLEERYRIDGDPFLAANIIAGELVRGISHRDGVFLDYTYFYVNQRVDHPCYLCGECGGDAQAALCTDYDLVADFDRATPLTYPLQRAYVVVDRAAPAAGEDVQVAANRQEYVEPVDDDVDVNFYPYNVEVRYVTRPYAYAYDSYWYDPFWYDPWYCGYVYYPGHRPYPYYGHYYSWSFSWGHRGGYYCSSWYYPRYHNWYDYYHDNYWNYANARSTVKYKSAYKERSSTAFKGGATSALAATRAQSVKRSEALRVGTKAVKRAPSATRVASKNVRARGTAVRGTKPVTTRSLVGKTRVTTRSGRALTGVTRGKAPSRIFGTQRGTRGTKSTYRPGVRSTTRRGSAVKRGGTSRPRVKSRSGASSRSRSKSSVKSRSGSRRSESSSVKRSSGSRSRSKSSSSRRGGSNKRSGSKGKRK